MWRHKNHAAAIWLISAMFRGEIVKVVGVENEPVYLCSTINFCVRLKRVHEGTTSSINETPDCEYSAV